MFSVEAEDTSLFQLKKPVTATWTQNVTNTWLAIFGIYFFTTIVEELIFNWSRVKMMTDEMESDELWDKIASSEVSLSYLDPVLFKNKWKTNR
jgi:hypothetical protein